MKMVELADTGTQVSALALGCLPMGTKVSEDLSFAMLDEYAHQGGNFLDTANNYSFWDANGQGGESEALLGRWFRSRDQRRTTFLATKLGAFPRVDRETFFSHKGDPWADLTEGLSRRAITQAVEASLKRLGTDYIDLLYAHVDDRRVDQDETMEAFDRLIKAGKVLHLGASNFKVWRLVRAQERAKAHGWTPYRAVQMFHTYLKTEADAPTGMADPMGPELFDYVRSGHRLSLLGYTPLLWGSYTQKQKYQEIEKLKWFDRPQNHQRLERLKRVAQQTGWTVNQVIYAWMLQSDPPVIPLVAVSGMDQLKENLAASELVLEPGHLSLLNSPLNELVNEPAGFR